MQLAVAERCVTSRARTATAVDQPLRRTGRSFRTAPLDIREGVHRGIERLCVALWNRRLLWHQRVEAHVDGRFASGSVVERFDVVEDRGCELLARRPSLAVDELELQGSEEVFRSTTSSAR